MLPALLLASLFIPQDKAAEKCALSGIVSDSFTGAPLNKVTILVESLSNSEGPLAAANTDARGWFSMADIDPSQYRVKGLHNGYLDTYYGARRGDGKGTIVTLEAGRAGATVALRRIIYRDGQRDLESSDEIVTDDLGQYRAANLTPGRYYVGPTALSNRSQKAMVCPTKRRLKAGCSQDWLPHKRALAGGFQRVCA
jgi:hypothetical protein